MSYRSLFRGYSSLLGFKSGGYPSSTSPSLTVQQRKSTCDNLLVASVYIIICSQILVRINAICGDLAIDHKAAVEEAPLKVVLFCFLKVLNSYVGEVKYVECFLHLQHISLISKFWLLFCRVETKGDPGAGQEE